MSTSKPVKKKIVVTEKQEASQRTKKGSPVRKSEKQPVEMLFTRVNYYFLFAGLALMAIGMLLMSGGSMPDYNTWDESLIYSPRRVILAPIVILSGIGVIIYSIFRK